MSRLLALALLFSCADEDEVHDPGRTFPDGFAWGTATAGFQVDMGCPTWDDDRCNDTHSDWYQWVTTPSIIDDSSLYVSGEPVQTGPGMWETYEDDIARMAADGMTAYRMSLEWSRLFPDGAAEAATTVEELIPLADADAVARYHQIFAALEEAGITPLVTLNHYTLPLWVHDGVACHEAPGVCEADGWVSGERIVPLIALYAGYAGREFGGEVDRWATLNEPFATTLSGYLLPGEDRSAPPGLLLDVDQTIAVMLHQIEGHAAMFDAVHREDSIDADGDGAEAEVGIVLNMVAITPRDETLDNDVRGVDNMDYLYHRLYLDALTAGAWDDDLDGTADRTRDELANRLDFVGINYYNRVTVLGAPNPIVSGMPTFTFVPEFSWDPYPEGLTEVTLKAAAYGLPLYISENGTPYVEDQGAEVLDGHLSALHDAIDQGADVRGYFYWSYVDNYEWNHGFDLRFGLYALDGDTKERVPRAVLERYREIAASNGLD